MSNSLDAVLFYGYLWCDDDDRERIGRAIHGVTEEDYDDCDHSPGDWIDIVHRRRGHVNPWDTRPVSASADDAAAERWIAENREALDRMYETKEAIDDEFGVAIGWHGHTDDQAPHLRIVGTEQRASYNNGLAVLPEMLGVDPDWRDRLDKWLAEFGIEAPQPEPGWWLVAEYG